MRFARRNMLLWGVWQGRGKPVFRTYFQPFIRQMQQLKNEGVMVTLDGVKTLCKGILLAGTMDLQAKANVCEMTHHNGEFACITCEDRGMVVTQGRGHCRIFPCTEEPSTQRSTTDILKCRLEASRTHKTVKGIKSVSCLLGMDWFDMVHGLVPDYMHGVLLGVTKRMLTLLLSSTNSKKQYFIGHVLKDIDKRLVDMQPTDQVERLPRKLEKNMHQLKASELQMWLLFYSVPCLTGLMERKYLDHLALMVEGIYILLGDNISSSKLCHAEHVLNTFHNLFGELYGENNMTLNLHNLGKHLTAYVRQLGPLWAWSCFPFEDMNGNMLDNVHGTGDVCMQILWTIQAQKRLVVDAAFMNDTPYRSFIQHMMKAKREVKIKLKTKNCSIAGGLSTYKLDDSMADKLKVGLGPDFSDAIGKVSKALRVVIGDNIFYSKEYTRMSKRVVHIVLTSPDTSLDVVSVQFFLYHHDSETCFAVVKKLTINTENPLLHPAVNHLISVDPHPEEDVHIVAANCIQEKVLYLAGNKDIPCISRLPNLFGQCS